MRNEDDYAFVAQQFGVDNTKPKRGWKLSITKIATNLFKHLRKGFKK